MATRPSTTDPALCDHPSPIDIRYLGDRNDRWLCSGCGQEYEGPPAAIRAAEARGYQRAIVALRARGEENHSIAAHFAADYLADRAPKEDDDA